MKTKSDRDKKHTSEKKGFYWRKGLLNTLKDPKHVIQEDVLITVIKDLYPKATFHYLVCPKEDIPDLKSVKAEHLELLKHMHNVAEKLCSKHQGTEFQIGYHSVPSMLRLHLHVISTDFISTFLKTKKHWNSFTSPFFIPSEKLIKELEENGKLMHKSTSEVNQFINQDLKCHKCEYKPKSMPDLKQHLTTHTND